MKQLLAVLIIGGAIILGAAYKTSVQAPVEIPKPESPVLGVGPGTPNYWCLSSNVLSPCSSAWSVGGASVATGTVLPTLGSPLNIGGVATSTITGDNTASYIPNFNAVKTVPTNYATAGCFGSSTTTDLGACINLAYSQAASGTKIAVPNLTQDVQYSTAIVFGTNAKFVTLSCIAGQRLFYNGTGTAITFNQGEGDPNSSAHIPHLGAENCIFEGATSSATTATTTGIQIGTLTSTGGESQLILNNVGAFNFGTGFVTASNTYMLALYNPSARGNVRNFQVNTAHNSGESIKIYAGNFVDPGNSSSSKCFYMNTSGAASLEVYGGSFDDCQIYLESGNLAVDLFGVHFENPFYTNYHGYDYIFATSSATTMVRVYGGIMMNDATSTGDSPPVAFINSATPVFASGVSVTRNTGATTTPAFLDTSVNAANLYGTVCNLIMNGTTPVLNIIRTNGLGALSAGASVVLSGCVNTAANSWQNGMIGDINNNVNFFNGGGVGMNFNAGAGAGLQTLHVGGSSVASGTIQASNTQSSTLAIGRASGATSTGSGCLKMYTASGTAQFEYITIDSAGVFFVTSTKPAICL